MDVINVMKPFVPTNLTGSVGVHHGVAELSPSIEESLHDWRAVVFSFDTDRTTSTMKSN